MRAQIAVWAALVGATLVSLFVSVEGEPVRGARWETVGGMAIIVIAFAKVRFIVFSFMELRTAPRRFRIAADLSIVGATLILMAFYGGAVRLLLASLFP